mmetsp:Transcript_76566/g.155408  ORF Transcript_76566/g.155408 Transcript_76566/m.155408 type:complete len:344 (+) Transcript_76566:305-1336(+)
MGMGAPHYHATRKESARRRSLPTNAQHLLPSNLSTVTNRGPHRLRVWASALRLPLGCEVVTTGGSGGVHRGGGGVVPRVLGGPAVSGGGGTVPVLTVRGGRGGVEGGRIGGALLLVASVAGGGGILLVGGGVLDVLQLAVEEQVDGDGPVLGAGHGAAQAQDLTGEEPVQQADGVLALVVGGDGNIDVGEGGVGVAERDHRHVHVRRLAHGLVVQQGVGHDQQARLAELLGDLVGEGTRGEAAGDGLGAGVLGVLQHSALGVGARGDGDHVGGVLDGDDDAGSQHQLLPGLGHVQDVDAIQTAAPDVVQHLVVGIAGAQVALGSQQLGDVLLPGSELSHDSGR